HAGEHLIPLGFEFIHVAHLLTCQGDNFPVAGALCAATGSASRPARLGYAPHTPMCARTRQGARAHTGLHHARGRPHRPTRASEPTHVGCAPHMCMRSRTTASVTCASSFFPCKGQVCTARRSMRAGTSLMCAAQGASRPHTSALTVQEHVMTRAPAQARVREE